MLWKSFLDKLGNTPLVELQKIESPARIFLKLESENPSGSIKDRPAFGMIQKAESEGLLKPATTILEPTSGNTGIALALISKLKGYRFHAVMPENVTHERRRLIEMYGAKITYSPAKEGSNGAIRLAQEMNQEDARFHMLYQYGNPENPLAHYKGTGPEILRDLEDITTFVAGLGTGGTLMGAGRYLKERVSLQIVASEPYPGDNVIGLRNISEGFVPPILDLDLLDRKIMISNEESVHYTRLLLEKEGLWTGVSTGANLAAALRVAKKGDKILVIAPDDGWRYLSSGIYDADYKKGQADDTLFW